MPAIHPQILIIDIGQIRGRGWAVREANAAWATAISLCDPLLILPTLVRASVRR